MSTLFPASIATLAAPVFAGQVQQLGVPTAAGDLTVLAGHEALLAPLRPGALHVLLADGTEQLYAVSGGMLQMHPQAGATLLLDDAVAASAISSEAAEAARARAEELLKNAEAADSGMSELEIARAMAEVARAQATLAVARRQGL